ncbi:hypothetical protein [Algoriphagus vanfongensis]|uniref:hypothetical protein n=1 Tax=Algoriphagus vanfongensis TaxID=426371 RepID=UPI0004035937|nr:hypothetical protein [Algoriphagus vanfongensis]
MPKPTDLIITKYEAHELDQIIDSYDLIKGIIDGFEGQANFKLDNTLPLIKGDSQELRQIFHDFIRRIFDFPKASNQEIHIVHIKNPKSWTFALILKSALQGKLGNTPDNLIETISELTLVISKKPIYNPKDLIVPV